MNAGQRVETDRLVGFCLLTRRDVVDRIGLLDEQFGIGNFEDDDFCRRALQAGFRALIAVDAFVHHFGGRTFVGSGVDFAQLMDDNRRKFDAKWTVPAATIPANCSTAAGNVEERAVPEPRAPRPLFTVKKASGGGLVVKPNALRLSLSS